MTPDHPTLSVVAPCFNEEGVLHRDLPAHQPGAGRFGRDMGSRVGE